MTIQGAAQVLHVGCGAYSPDQLPPLFRGAGWREIRLDIDPDVNPDLIASIIDMHIIADCSMGAVFSAHNIEHLYPHEVPVALAEIRRVLKPTGFAYFTLPDLQEVARHIAVDKLEDPLYISPMGPIAPLDILFGHRSSMERGNSYMAHHVGFTSSTLGSAFIDAGFAAAIVQRNQTTFSLTAIAFRSMPTQADCLVAQSHMVPDRPAVFYQSTC